jgi:hypothetical protein
MHASGDLILPVCAAEATAWLPTFNSNVIESLLHRIPGLTTCFLAMNNDLFFGQPTQLSDFQSSALRRDRSFVQVYVAWSNYFLARQCTAFVFKGTSMVDPAKLSILIPDLWPVPIKAPCFGTMLYWDRVVAARVFRVSIMVAFAHVPHLWCVPHMRMLETQLGAYLERARRNRFRNRTTDLTWHVQYEAFLRHMSYKQGPKPHRTLHVMDRTTVDWEGYQHETFSDCTTNGTLAFYASVNHTWTVNRPQFFAMEDDLPVGASPQCVALHRDHLQRLFVRQWPYVAPWEFD